MKKCIISFLIVIMTSVSIMTVAPEGTGFNAFAGTGYETPIIKSSEKNSESETETASESESESETETESESQTESQTESETEAKKKVVKKKGKWKLSKNRYYYYTPAGKKAKGIYKINGKKYYFDEKGIQRVGWQKIGRYYYYFRIANGRKGYMVTSKTVNHIKLRSNGRAYVPSSSKKRMKVLYIAQQEVQKATKSNPTASKMEKLKTCWKYFLKHYSYVESPDYTYKSGWEVNNAYYTFVNGRGDCQGQGAAFAFIANACGCTKAYSVSSGGHGWTEVNGRVCDPTWAKVDTAHDYFYMKMSLSGVGGRPLYSRNRVYVYKI